MNIFLLGCDFLFWAEYLNTTNIKDYDTVNILNVEYVKKNGILRQKSCVHIVRNKLRKPLPLNGQKEILMNLSM